MAKTAREEAQKIIADNRKAHHDYHLIETFEAGVALLGTEVKSIREGGVQLRDSFARIEGARSGSTTSTSAPTATAATAITSPRASRKLPLHRQEIKKLIGKTVEKGMTLVPVRMYLKNGRIKVAISLAKGKQDHDKRETIKRREADRETRAAVEGKTVDYSPYEDESRGPHRGSDCRRRRPPAGTCSAAAAPIESISLRSSTAPRRPARPAYSIIDATLAGDTKRAILAPPNGRITFKVRVPDDGWLKVSLGLKPEAWDKEGNGVHLLRRRLRRPVVRKLFEQTVNPFANPSERRWIPVTVDLSAYAGEEMQVILNTRSSGAASAATTIATICRSGARRKSSGGKWPSSARSSGAVSRP